MVTTIAADCLQRDDTDPSRNYLDPKPRRSRAHAHHALLRQQLHARTARRALQDGLYRLRRHQAVAHAVQQAARLLERTRHVVRPADARQ
jgi:hypothetical protein